MFKKIFFGEGNMRNLLMDITDKNVMYVLFKMCIDSDDRGQITGSPVDLAKRYSMSRSMFEVAVSELKKLGLIRKVKNSVYMVSPKLLYKGKEVQLGRAMEIWENQTIEGRRNKKNNSKPEGDI